MSRELDELLETLGPKVRAQFEQLQRHYARYSLPQRPPQHLQQTRRGHRTNEGRGPKRPKPVRYSIPPSWENRGGKRVTWAKEMTQRVGKATIELVAEFGTRGFTVKDVAKRAGVARSTIYKHWGIKAELLAKCMENYWLCGRPAHLAATERDFYRIVLEGLCDGGADGPSVADLLVQFAVRAARNAERNVWLLTVAEGIRSKRPPHFKWRERGPNPLRHDVSVCLGMLLHAAREPGTGAESSALAEDVAGTVLHVLQALVWYEACLNGPTGDERWLPPPGTKVTLRGKPRVRSSAPEQRQAQADVCRQAIDWVLHGAGLADLRLRPLPGVQGNKLPKAVRYGHPTGWFVHHLQTYARLFDLDDFEALHAYSSPQTVPLDPPPRLPGALAPV